MQKLFFFHKWVDKQNLGDYKISLINMEKRHRRSLIQAF